MRFWPERRCACRVRVDSRPHVPGHAPAIRILILSDLLYFPGPVIGHMCIPELLFLCFYGEVVRAGVQLELTFYPSHVVVGQVRQPRYARVVRAPVPRRRIGVAAYASGNSFWAFKAIFFGYQDVGPSVVE